MNITSLTPAQLRKAAALKEQIESLQNQLSQISGGGEAPGAQKAAKAKKKISAAGIARIRAAQKARWAKLKAKAPKASVPAKAKAKKGRRKISAEARARMAAAAKARWAKIKAAKAK